jgi:signal transduction histidine kinase
MATYKTPVTMAPYNDQHRLERLYQYEILDTPAENSYNAIVSLAVELFEADGAAIVFIAEKDVFVKASRNNNSTEGILFASAPITTQDGFILGSINVSSSKARPELSEREMKMLVMLANLVMEALEARLVNLNAGRTYHEQIHRMSHDLKNPVTSISLYAQLLGSQQMTTEKVSFMAEKIGKSIKTLQEQLKNIVHS